MMQHLMVLDARFERQVVTLDTLCEYFPGQVYLARDFPGIASPLITGDNARQEGGKQVQPSTACFIVARTSGVGNNSFSFSIKDIKKCRLFWLPT
ncbi:MAG: hypothetical protein RIQ83_1543 [Pseudomonadota bacterium]|jgi:hypothetical protein